MEGEVFFKRYKLCRDAEGKPDEAGRTGPAIIYKAIDEESDQPVVLQLVPLAAIDQTRRNEFESRAKAVQAVDHINVARVLAAGVEHGYFAFVTEYLEGETADAWIVANGTMTPDAVLRVGMQVVRAAAAAAFHGLTHRAIQPSNVIILHGESPGGGWPFVKVLNFGVAALESHGESKEARELAPALVPQFASPEQVRNEPIDFRSEMYSLGATMCFLLTGAVPLPSGDEGGSGRRGRRRLPELQSMPKPVRRLLRAMLAENPEDRPLDPVALERYMGSILSQVERRNALARKFGIPLAAQVQRKIARSRSPIAQVLRGGLAVAALLLALALAGAIIYPYVHRNRPVDEIGVPVAESTNATGPSRSPGDSPPVNNVADVQSNSAPSIAPVPVATPANATASHPATDSSAAANVANAQSNSPESNEPPQPGPVSGTSSAIARNKESLNPEPSPFTPTSSGSWGITSSKQTTASPVLPETESARAQSSPTQPISVAQDEPETSAAKVHPGKRIASSRRNVASSEKAKSSLRDVDNEPEPPSGGPSDEEEDAPPARSNQPNKSESRTIARIRASSEGRHHAAEQRSHNGRWGSARFIGVTPKGKMLFRLPSGRIIAMNPRHRRTPVAVRPRSYQYPPPYYVPPANGYPVPGSD